MDYVRIPILHVHGVYQQTPTVQHSIKLKVLENTKLPYVPYFSFGEELAVEKSKVCKKYVKLYVEMKKKKCVCCVRNDLGFRIPTVAV